MCQTRRWTYSTNVCHRTVMPHKEKWTNSTNMCHTMRSGQTAHVCHRRVVPYKERWTNSTKSIFEPVVYWDSNRVLLVHIPSVLLLHHPQTVTEIIRHLYSPTTCAKGEENLRTGKLKLRYAHRVLHFRHYVWHIDNVPHTHYMGTNKTAVTWTAQIKITCSGSSINTDQKLSLLSRRWRQALEQIIHTLRPSAVNESQTATK